MGRMPIPPPVHDTTYDENRFYIIPSSVEKKKPKAPPPAVSNRRARHDYEILDTLEAGIVLKGPEVKSLRESKASLRDSFARVENGELFLYQMHITPYSYTHHEDLNPTRARKLLLHKQQIKKLAGRVQERGLTLIPLEVFFNRKGFAKVNLALAKGKRGPDRREDIKKRDLEREARREFRARTRF
jgi:SsrA-binding protein